MGKGFGGVAYVVSNLDPEFRFQEVGFSTYGLRICVSPAAAVTLNLKPCGQNRIVWGVPR